MRYYLLLLFVVDLKVLKKYEILPCSSSIDNKYKKGVCKKLTLFDDFDTKYDTNKVIKLNM